MTPLAALIGTKVIVMKNGNNKPQVIQIIVVCVFEIFLVVTPNKKDGEYLFLLKWS